MDTLKDPRRGLPSAHLMFRLSQCPGSNRLIAEVRKRNLYYQPPDAIRESGLRIHRFLHKREVDPPLSKAELGTAEACARIADELYSAWSRDDEHISQLVEYREKRFWVRRGILPLFSAQPDLVFVIGARALVLNYKTGRKEAQAAADNLQLRTEAVALKANFPGLQSIQAAVVEPWVSWSPERVEYGEKALADALAEILAIIERAQTDGRVAGEWCVYCPARPHCQEARDYVQAVYSFGRDVGFAELPVGERGSKVIEDIRAVREILDSMEARYKEILTKDPGALANHQLHEGHLLRSISDLAAARDRLVPVIGRDGFEECLTASVAKLEQEYADKSGLKLGLKNRLAEKAFADLMNGLIGSRRAAPYIAKISRSKQRQLKQ